MPRKVLWPRVPDDPTDPEGLAHLLHRFITWMRAMGFSEHTIRHRDRSLSDFIAWCAERGLKRPGEVTPSLLERYRERVYRRTLEDGRPLSSGSRMLPLTSLKTFFRWLVRKNVLGLNPAAELELPRREFRLPRHVFTKTEVDQVLNRPKIATAVGLRDRAMLETFYSTGIRRAELASLNVPDLDFERGIVFVRMGKGKKDRLVPIGERALAWIRKYLDEARPLLLKEIDTETLFLSRNGGALTPGTLTDRLRPYILAAGIEKRGACHIYRHTMATLMLENGADIRFLQEILGHASLESTQLYTKVAIAKLKEVHERTHPAAGLERKTPPLAAEPPASGEPKPERGREREPTCG